MQATPPKQPPAGIPLNPAASAFVPTFGAEAERAARNAAHEQRARHEKERYERWMAKKVEKKARRVARTSAAVAAAADALVAEARAASPPPRLNSLRPIPLGRPRLQAAEPPAVHK